MNDGKSPKPLKFSIFTNRLLDVVFREINYRMEWRVSGEDVSLYRRKQEAFQELHDAILASTVSRQRRRQSVVVRKILKIKNDKAKFERMMGNIHTLAAEVVTAFEEKTEGRKGRIKYPVKPCLAVLGLLEIARDNRAALRQTFNVLKPGGLVDEKLMTWLRKRGHKKSDLEGGALAAYRKRLIPYPRESKEGSWAGRYRKEVLRSLLKKKKYKSGAKKKLSDLAKRLLLDDNKFSQYKDIFTLSEKPPTLADIRKYFYYKKEEKTPGAAISM